MRVKLKLIISSVVVSIIATVSLWIVYKETGKLQAEWWKLILVALCTVGATLYVLYKKAARRLIVFGCLGGFLYGLMYVYGAYVHNHLETVRTIGALFKMLMWAIGFAVFPAMLFMALLMLLPKARKLIAMGKNEVVITRKKAVLTCLMYIGIVFVMWLPVFLAYYPVLLEYDGVYQLRDVVNNTHSTWHPLAHTLLMGMFYKLGVSVGSAAFGMALYSLLQMLILSGFMGYTIYVMYRNGAPKWFRIAFLVIYAIFPVNAILSITTTKDVLFAAFFLGFIVLLANGIVKKNSYTWVQIVVVMVVGGIMLLYRNNAIYAFVAAAPFIIWNVKGARIKILCAILGSVILYAAADKTLIMVAKAPESNNVTEKLSVPLMQLAYVVSDPFNKLTPEEREEIFRYIPEHSISGYYLVISDQIKGNANNELLGKNFLNFVKLWSKVLIKHPMQYVDAAALLTMGYWYMDDIYNAGIYGKYMLLGHKEIGIGEEIQKTCYFPLAKKAVNAMFGKNQYQKIPILSQLCTPAFYFWILMGYLLTVWYEKRNGLAAPGILCLMYYATLFLGPVALVRYMYCVMIATPVLLFMLLCKNDSTDDNTDNLCIADNTI